MLEWNVTRKEDGHITTIIKRLYDAGHIVDMVSTRMDIEAAHSNGCPLKLAKMATAPMGQLSHDVNGISRFIDRETGKLEGGFWPRYAI